LPKCTSTKFAALGPDRDFFIAALAEVKIHRNYYEISLRCKVSGQPVHAGGFFARAIGKALISLVPATLQRRSNGSVQCADPW
jgi:hypothetical protein